MKSLEDRIEELEVRQAFQDDTIRQLDEVVRELAEEVERLRRELRELKEQEANPLGEGNSPEDEVPPHY